MKYRYEVADIVIAVELPYELNIDRSAEAFIYADDSDFPYDLRASFIRTSELEELPEGGHWIINQYHVQVDGTEYVYFTTYRDASAYICVEWHDDEIECRYLGAYESELNYASNIFDVLNLESIARKHDGVMIHSSLIDWKNNGIVFSAPSGTGKSTQAELWAEYEGADILNGDRAILRKIDNRWRAYGLPFAGTSGIFRNESVDLSMIVVLSQAKENVITRPGPSEIIRCIYPEVTTHRWDKAFSEYIIQKITELMMEIPVVRLECLPDRGAVEVLKRMLEDIND